MLKTGCKSTLYFSFMQVFGEKYSLNACFSEEIPCFGLLFLALDIPFNLLNKHEECRLCASVYVLFAEFSALKKLTASAIRTGNGYPNSAYGFFCCATIRTGNAGGSNGIVGVE